ncbi:organic cation transporter protein isoform X2 [Anoplophora glabripennis]|uniref:organic cation transporter protein isoform X2 n=1 Tax=Anoplophora glabripennis TaxID=217634 RepID=UPI00087414EE|nr:organic cation transporter protein isoform X2 [Anoplophora glabripennis]
MSKTMQNGTEKGPPKDKADVDIIQKCIGVLGRWHIWVCLIIFLVKFPVAWHQLSIVFVAPPVTFTCAENITDKCSSNCSSHVFDTSIFTNTIAIEWDLVCQKQYLANLAQTITMLGILFGNMVFGYLSDRFGRRNPLVLAVILQAVSGLAAAFSPWFTLFLIMRFLAALATGGTMVTSFVLVMELVGTEWRTVLGILYQIPFNLGHLILPLISYFLRDWRYFQAAISAPSLCLVIYYWVLPESPRWQLAVGKKDEAVAVLKKAAKRNELPTDTIEQDVTEYLAHKDLKEVEQSKGNIIDLIRTPIMRMYTIAICFNWTVCGLCFFGVSQFIGQLGGNIFVNVALSAVIQIPSTLFACWSTKAWGRKKTLIAGNVVSGVAMLLIGFVPSDPAWIKSTLSTIGMFGLALSFPTVYIYSGELFPTVVRNIGVGTSSMCARIGSMIAPFVATLVTVEPWIPPVIFGIVPLVGALLCYKLPETLDCKLPDTIEEAEQFEMQKKKSGETEMH